MWPFINLVGDGYVVPVQHGMIFRRMLPVAQHRIDCAGQTHGNTHAVGSFSPTPKHGREFKLFSCRDNLPQESYE